MRSWFRNAPTRTVQAYVQAMNAHDADGMAALMDENILLIDSSGYELRGRDAARAVFARLFAEAGTFELRIDRYSHSGDQVLMTGVTSSDHPAVSDSRHFSARADEHHVREWQSFAARPLHSFNRLLQTPPSDPQAANAPPA